MNNVRYAERSAGVRQGLCSDEKKRKQALGFFCKLTPLWPSAQMPSALLIQEMAQTSPALAEAT